MTVDNVVKSFPTEKYAIKSKQSFLVTKNLAVDLILLGMICFAYFIIATKYFKLGFVDDTYISLRYVRHVVQGHGLVWNIGERPVEGFTNLGWILILAGFRTSDINDLQWVARLSGICCGVLVLILTWLIAKKLLPSSLSSRYALIVPLHLAFNPIFCRHAVSGMETMLTALILGGLLACWAYIDYARYSVLAGAVGAIITFLGALARPDAVLFGISGTLGIMFLRRMKGLSYIKESIVYGIVFVVLLTGFLLWKQSYFGSIIPLPFYMKQNTFRIFSSFHFLFFVLGHWFGFIAYIAPLLLVSMLTVAVRKYDVTPLIVALSSGTLVYGFYFLTVLPVMSFEWRYLFPLYPGITLLAFAGLLHLINETQVGRTADTVRASKMSLAMTLFLFSFYNLGQFSGIKSNADGGYNAHKSYGEIGKSLANVFNISIACSEAGQLPYFSDKRFLDIAGLNDAFVAKNISKSSFATLYGDYVKISFGLPDVYFEPSNQFPFARLERFNSNDAYERYVVNGISLYVLKSSPQYQKILDSLVANKAQQHTKTTNYGLEE